MRVFVAEYLKDRNGTRAAIRAGYSKTSAAQQAERMLRKDEICAAVEEGLSRITAKCELSVERTLREVARIAYFDPRRMFREDGSPKDLHELDDDTAAAIAGLEVLEEFEGSGPDRIKVGHVKKYKISDKNSALDKAMKHLGLFEHDNKQSNPAEAMHAFMAELSARGSRLPIKGNQP